MEAGGETEFDLAIHTSGSSSGLQEAIDRVGMEGRVVEVSWYGTAETTLRLGGTFTASAKLLPPARCHPPASSDTSLGPRSAASSWCSPCCAIRRSTAC
jgi:threonine dehydrogenase-like Zn-dependent dehydrogenase